ncbi:MAG: NRDE family protein, partial [Bacteroidota bacterium]
MCLIFFSYKEHPKYDLIIAANRDEFYERPTTQAKFWEEYPSILAGRDQEAGGTWMGISRQGKVSMLTNYRDPANIKSNAPSRGHLVSDFLKNGESPEAYLSEIAKNGEAYNGFNLLVGDRDNLWYYSNYKKKYEVVEKGLHGLSNHLLDTGWPKVKKGLGKMSHLMSEETIDPEVLFDAMYDDHIAKDNELPNTGVGLERERMLSPMFIKSPVYGSRCSTVTMFDKSGKIFFAERTYDLSN